MSNLIPNTGGGWSRLTCAFLLAFGFASSAAADVFTIDFDTDAMGNPIVLGQIIDDEYANWGVTISAKDPGGGPLCG